MLYFKLDSKLEVIEIAKEMPAELRAPGGCGAGWYRRGDGSFGPGGWINQNDIDSFMLAQQIADSASKLSVSEGLFIAVDRGDSYCSRYDVIKAPAYGDECSMAFNGDYYPVGKIVAIRGDYKRIRVEGQKGPLIFIRRKLSGAWLNKGFSLVPGVISKWNPEF